MKNLTAALAFTATALPALAQTTLANPPPRGHADSMPLYGPSENKTCPDGGKPGNWYLLELQFVGANVATIKGNDCKQRVVLLDPGTLQPIELTSIDRAMKKPRPVAGASELTIPWWQGGGNLPAHAAAPVLQNGGEIKNGNQCAIGLPGGASAYVPAGSVIVPDLHSAWSVRMAYNKTITQEVLPNGSKIIYGTDGRPYCTLEPLIVVPDTAGSSTAVASVSGGGLHNPGHISLPPATTPAAAVVPLAAEAGAEGLVAAFEYLSQSWLGRYIAQSLGRTIIYSYGTDVLNASKEIQGLSAEQIGWLNSGIGAIPAPTQGDVDAAKKRLDRTETAEARRLSELPGGNCPDDHKKLEGVKDGFCTAPAGFDYNCDSARSSWENLVLARRHMACVIKREEIMDKCYDGGNSGHLAQAQQALKRVQKCLDTLVR